MHKNIFISYGHGAYQENVHRVAEDLRGMTLQTRWNANSLNRN